MEEERKLSKHIDSHYKLVGVQPGEVIIGKVKYDFRTITKEQADKLFETERGKKYLQKISKEDKVAPVADKAGK